MWLFLRSPGSNWCDTLAELCRRQGGDVRMLDLPRALSAAPRESEIALDDEALTWGGVDLRAAQLLLVERPLYSWPQTAGRDEARAQAEREARALALSALHVAGQRVPLVNALHAGHWAAHPAAALDELQERGIEVHPWHLAQRASAGSSAAAGVRLPGALPQLLPALRRRARALGAAPRLRQVQVRAGGESTIDE